MYFRASFISQSAALHFCFYFCFCFSLSFLSALQNKIGLPDSDVSLPSWVSCDSVISGQG